MNRLPDADRELGEMTIGQELRERCEALEAANAELRSANGALEAKVAALEAARLGPWRHDDAVRTLAHELRNPLGPIVNAVYVLQRLTGGDPRARHLVEIIGRQARHLTHVVEAMLDVARSRS